MTQDTNIENLIINKLTKAQYEGILNPDPKQLYFITDEVISSADVISALGYIPYDASNPSGYTSNIGTVTSVNNVSPVSGNVTLSIPSATSDLTNDSGFITSSDLTNYVTTNTAQNISGRKTFLGEKAIYFKQDATTNKLGFTLYNPSDTELGAFEYRPNTINGNALLNVNTSYSNACYVGFRYWGTSVNVIAPKVATAGNYFIPTHITNGNTTVTASNTGTVNISTLLPDVSNFVTSSSLATTLEGYAETSDIPTAISDLTDDTGTNPIDKAESVADQRDSSPLKYWTGTKAQYDAIATKDPHTLYNVTGVETDADQIITELANKTNINFNNVADEAKVLMAGMAMPSDSYIDLTLGASGTTYTAPADGYVYFNKACTGAGQYITLSGNISYRAWSTASGQSLLVSVPVKKGTNYEVSYSAGGNLNVFRFVYAQGSESEAN